MGQAHDLPQPTQLPSPHESEPSDRAPGRSGVPVHIWILILVVLVLLGFLLYDLRAAYQESLTYWDSNLSNSADEQTSIETLWLLERRTDTEGIASNSATIRMLSKKVSEAQRAATRQEVEAAIDKMAHINGFMGGAVADTECRILAQTGVPAEAMEGVRRACLEVQATQAYSVVASYPRPSHLLVNMAVPVSAGEAASTGSPNPSLMVGVAVMISEPRRAVSRFFVEKSRPDRFAETEIIWQDRGEAVGFSPQLNAIGMGSLIRQPLGAASFESRAARELHEEFGEFTDYRGVRVFGVARPILAAGASLARKVDKDQALAEFHKRALLEWLAAALSLLLLGAVILAQHRQQAMRDLQEKLRQQQALLDLKRHVEASEERYRAFVANSTEAIWRIETEKPISTALAAEEQVNHVLQFAYLAECNDSMARMFGFEHASELIGLRVKNLVQFDPRQIANLRAFISSGYRLADAEFLAKDRQGKIHHFLNTYLGIVEGGFLLRAWGVLRDVTERKRADVELVDRLRFETLLADLSARLADVPAERLGAEIEGALRRVCECLELDECTLWQAPEEAPRLLRLAYTHRSSEGPPGLAPSQIDAREHFPWSLRQIMSGRHNVVAVSSLVELPEEAGRDRETYTKFGLKSVLTIALAAGGRPPMGALAFGSTRAERTWPEEIVNRLQLVAQTFADALARQRLQQERQRSFDQLRALAARLQSVREEERKRVAREIHDQLGQALTAIKLDLSSLVRGLPGVHSPLLEKGTPLLRLVDETIESVRRISTELRPGMLDDLGLAATVEWAAEEFASRTGTKCLLDLATEQIAVDSETATAVFRIFQETLTNVARHAKASEVKVRLAEENGDLTLEVHDDGRGIGEDELARTNSLGILGMRERALLLGGTLTITGEPDKGTTVRLRIPEVRHA